MIKKILDNQFGPSEVPVGKPLGFSQDELREYFEKYYVKSIEPVEITARRFGLKGKRILSIASGTGMEEITFARQGNVVECIEPNPDSAAVFKHFIGKLGTGEGEIIIHEMPMRDFKSPNKFDFIYSSSPTDWMTSDFRQAIPTYYIEFFNRFAAKQCVIFLKLYSSCYRRYVLVSSWLPKAIAAKLYKQSHFRMREYWLADNGRHSAVVAANFQDLPPATGDFEKIFMRGDVKAHLAESRSHSAPALLSVLDKAGPYVIVTKHFIRRLVRKVIRRDILSEW
jgi:hypothetical protein